MKCRSAIPLFVLLLLFLSGSLTFAEESMTPVYPGSECKTFRFPEQFYIKVPTGADEFILFSENADVKSVKLYEFVSAFKSGKLLSHTVGHIAKINSEWSGKEVYAMLDVQKGKDVQAWSDPMICPFFSNQGTEIPFATKEIETAWIATVANKSTEFLFRSNAPILAFELQYTLRADKAEAYKDWGRKNYFPIPIRGQMYSQDTPFMIKTRYAATRAPIYVRGKMIIQDGYHPGGNVYSKAEGAKEYKHEIVSIQLQSTVESEIPAETQSILLATAGDCKPLWFCMSAYVGVGEATRKLEIQAVMQDDMPIAVEEDGVMVGYDNASQIKWKIAEKNEEILQEFRENGARWGIGLSYSAFGFTRNERGQAVKSLKLMEFQDAQSAVILDPIAEKLPPFDK